MNALSHPSRVRGLKQTHSLQQRQLSPVAPLAGAWIETFKKTYFDTTLQVAPLAGAWIETPRFTPTRQATGGRTPRGCVD